MALTPQQMDAKMDEHFAFEGRDDVEGVLATLADDVEHDIVGWPLGPTHGREGARGFYETLFVDLADSKVRSVKRLYGDNFMVDESLWSGPGAGQAVRPRGPQPTARVPAAARDGVRRQRRHQARERVARPRRDHPPTAAGLTWQRTQSTAGVRTSARARARTCCRPPSRLMQQGRKPEPGGDRRGGDGLARDGVPLFPQRRGAAGGGLVDVAVPEADELFGARIDAIPSARLERVDTALHDMILANEPPLRTMLAHSLQRGIRRRRRGRLPGRQNRRTPLIEAALAPARKQFKPGRAEDTDAGPRPGHGSGRPSIVVQGRAAAR